MSDEQLSRHSYLLEFLKDFGSDLLSDAPLIEDNTEEEPSLNQEEYSITDAGLLVSWQNVLLKYGNILIFSSKRIQQFITFLWTQWKSMNLNDENIDWLHPFFHLVLQHISTFSPGTSDNAAEIRKAFAMNIFQYLSEPNVSLPSLSLVLDLIYRSGLQNLYDLCLFFESCRTTIKDIEENCLFH